MRSFQMLFIAAVALFVVGCAAAPLPSATVSPSAAALPSAGTPVPSATAPSATPETISLLTEPAPAPACMEALAQGQLVPDPRSGLGLADASGQRTPVMWPFRYSARLVDGVIELLDDSGTAVAREGDTVQLGGGTGPGGFFFTCAGAVERVSS